jgi:putative ABC transport system ATP-binding protein
MTGVVIDETAIEGPETALVRASNVRVRFSSSRSSPPVLALDGATMAARPGELVVIEGPSGSGKSTLLAVISGLRAPDEGQVELAGERIDGLSAEARARVRRRHVGFVFQRPNLFPGLSALDNVAEPLALSGVPIARARERAIALLTEMGLGERLRHRPGKLSGGEQQRVAIARALAPGPAIVFGDEPTASLDGARAMQMMELFRGAVTKSRCVVLVTHDARVGAFADRRFKLDDGKLARVTAEPHR